MGWFPSRPAREPWLLAAVTLVASLVSLSPLLASREVLSIDRRVSASSGYTQCYTGFGCSSYSDAADLAFPGGEHVDNGVATYRSKAAHQSVVDFSKNHMVSLSFSTQARAGAGNRATASASGDASLDVAFSQSEATEYELLAFATNSIPCDTILGCYARYGGSMLELSNDQGVLHKFPLNEEGNVHLLTTVVLEPGSYKLKVNTSSSGYVDGITYSQRRTGGDSSLRFDMTAIVPEPSTWALFAGISLTAVIAMRNRIHQPVSTSS